MTIWITSDQHFGHAATVEKFKRPNGDPLRPFSSVEEMNEALVERWNKVVGPNDVVFNLGDVCMSHRHLHFQSRLNGTKHLIAGNHDPLIGKKAKKFNFGDYFDSIGSLKELDGMLLTHVPVHEQSLDRWGVNVHGHLHANEVMKMHGGKPTNNPDPRYLCVSVERTDFKPISLEDVKKRIEGRQRNVR